MIYEKLGTKGLVLQSGKVVRELNRSFYHAHVYEYPIAIWRSANGRVLLAHCPNEYCRLEIEDLVTGERVGGSRKRKPADFFHSRLRISSDGRWLLSAGWIWHPFSMVSVFDLEVAMKKPNMLDRGLELPAIDGEVAAAEFLPNNRMLISTSDESLGNEGSVIETNAAAIIDIECRQVTSQTRTHETIGSLMTIDEEVAVGFFEHPKLFSLRTGAVLERWETINSGDQTSSIIWNGVSTPPIAVDVARRRFAVAEDSGVCVVQVSA